MFTIVFKNGLTIQADSVTFEPHFSVEMTSRDDIFKLWADIDGNLDELDVYRNGTKVAVFEYCEIIGIQIYKDHDVYRVHFYMEGNQIPFTDPEYVEAYNVLVGGSNE